MLSLLITLILLLAGCAIVGWLLTQLSLPEPVRIAAIAVMAIIVLIVLFALLPIGGVSFPALRR
jgi:hypothetical protein